MMLARLTSYLPPTACDIEQSTANTYTCPATSMNYIKHFLDSSVQGTVNDTHVSDDQDTDHADSASDKGSHTSNHITSTSTATPSIKTIRDRHKTTYTFAHPPPLPPKHHHRLRLRPRLLVQLRKHSHDSRPAVPVLDVFPYSHTAWRHPFSGRGMHAGDLLITDSQGQADTEDGVGSDGWEHVVAMIRRPKAKDSSSALGSIILPHGDDSWEATRLAKGGYEFVSLGDTTAPARMRWIPRHKTSKARPRSMSSGVNGVESSPQGYSFSIIEPGTRRHAVIATLGPDALDIFDSYSKVPPLARANESESSTATNTTLSKDPTSSMHGQDAIEVSSRLRMLIASTAILLALTEGYIPDMSSNGGSAAQPPSPSFPPTNNTHTSTTTGQSSIQRSQSLDIRSTGPHRSTAPAAGARPSLSASASTSSQSDGSGSRHYTPIESRRRSKRGSSLAVVPIREVVDDSSMNQAIAGLSLEEVKGTPPSFSNGDSNIKTVPVNGDGTVKRSSLTPIDTPSTKEKKKTHTTTTTTTKKKKKKKKTESERSSRGSSNSNSNSHSRESPTGTGSTNAGRLRGRFFSRRARASG